MNSHLTKETPVNHLNLLCSCGCGILAFAESSFDPFTDLNNDKDIEQVTMLQLDSEYHSDIQYLQVCFICVTYSISNKTVFPGSNSQLWLCYFTGANRSQTPLLSNLKVLLTYEWSFKETGIRFLSKPVSVPSFWYCSIIYSFGIAFWVRRVLLLIIFLTE